MPEALDIDALMKAAAQAARRDDAAEAATLLRQAVRLQEESLGPHDRELAPTLNNLAMMLERQGETAEAERCYRRAYDIARHGAAPNDQLAQVSRANLVDFLRATGKLDIFEDDLDTVGEPEPPAMTLATPEAAPVAPAPARVPPPPPVAPPPPPVPLTRAASAPRPPAAAPSPRPRAAAPTPTAPADRPLAPRPPQVVRPQTGGRTGLWALAGVVLAIAVAAWFLVGRGGDQGGVSPERSPASDITAESSRPTPSAPPAADATPVTPPPPEPPPTAPPKEAARPAGVDSLASTATVEGSLCRALVRNAGAWRCEGLAESGAHEAVYYYTRVKSGRDLIVRHRWTYQGKVVQMVSLQVRANPGEGFRTFSRQRVAGRTGEWQIESLAADGTVLDTRQFTVSR